MAGSKGHPGFKTFVEKFRESHEAAKKAEHPPLHLRKCLKGTNLITLYETGPFFTTMAYLLSHD